MKIKIDFPPYDSMEVMEVLDDGSVICDLYIGDDLANFNRVFPVGSPYYPDLSDEEKSQLKNP